jgi:hypothetical protein
MSDANATNRRRTKVDVIAITRAPSNGRADLISLSEAAAQDGERREKQMRRSTGTPN